MPWREKRRDVSPKWVSCKVFTFGPCEISVLIELTPTRKPHPTAHTVHTPHTTTHTHRTSRTHTYTHRAQATLHCRFPSPPPRHPLLHTLHFTPHNKPTPPRRTSRTHFHTTIPHRDTTTQHNRHTHTTDTPRQTKRTHHWFRSEMLKTSIMQTYTLLLHGVGSSADTTRCGFQCNGVSEMTRRTLVSPAPKLPPVLLLAHSLDRIA